MPAIFLLYKKTMFKNNIFLDYNLHDATGEILLMLFISFLLGYLLGRLLGCRCSHKEAVIDTPLSTDENDLKVVEGIGPKIEELLKDAKITTWSDLARADTEQLQKILSDAGSRFQMHDPRTWAEQAVMARDGKWTELAEYQDFLVGGK